MKRISLILLSLLALCSLDGGGKTIHRSFRGGYPSAVTEARIQSVSAMPVRWPRGCGPSAPTRWKRRQASTSCSSAKVPLS